MLSVATDNLAPPMAASLATTFAIEARWRASWLSVMRSRLTPLSRSSSAIQTLTSTMSKIWPKSRQQPLTMSPSLHCSLDENDLTNDGRDMSGVIKLADALKENTSLLSIR